MPLVLEEPRSGALDLCPEPRAVRVGDHRVATPLPHGDRHRDSLEREGPVAGKGEVVVVPAPVPVESASFNDVAR